MSTGSYKKQISIKRIFAGLCVVFLPFIFIYLILWALNSSRMRWIYADKDNDGIALYDDLNPDGDKKGFYADRDADNNGIRNEKQALSYARSMLGTRFDPMMGMHHNLLGKIGMVVCIDVPIQSYLKAGVSFPAAMKQATGKRPKWFDIGPDNSPKNVFFYRRVRNYFDLFTNAPGLTTSQNPMPGDFAFYGRTHAALVVSVKNNKDYQVIEADPIPGKVVKMNNRDMMQHWGTPSFFGRIRYENK